MANMTACISEYLFNGLYSVNQPMPTEEEKAFLLEILTQDFYFIEDVKQMFVEKFGEEMLPHLNPRTFKELGYLIYVNYIVSDRYTSSAAYFKHLILKDDTFDMNNLDGRMIYVQQFNETLIELRSGLDVIEYEDRKYIKYEHFIKVLPECDKQTLQQYVYDTISYSEGREFFTIKSLINNGYDHALHHIGFGDWFNGALLKNSKEILFVRTGGTILFYTGKKKKMTVDFFGHILSEQKSMDVYKMEELLREQYGISFHKDKLVQMVKGSDIYYDSIMEKMYLNKDYFYEDI